MGHLNISPSPEFPYSAAPRPPALYRLRYAWETVAACWKQAQGCRRMRRRSARSLLFTAARTALIGALLASALLTRPPDVRAARSVAFTGPTTNPFGLADVGDDSAPTFADLDGDGDLDAFVGGDYGMISYFKNSGTATSPAFSAPSSNPFGLTDVGFNSTPAFADLDADGDLDALVGENDGILNYFPNTGTAVSPAFAAVTADPFYLTDVGFNSAPAFADLDADGDLDVLVGERDGTLNYFRNTGSATDPSFSSASANPFGLSNVGPSSAPAFADIDDDGDLDVFVGEEDGAINYFRNTGTAVSPAFASSSLFGLTDVGSYSAPAFADLNADGDLDVFVGETGGSIHYFQNAGAAALFTFSGPTANPFGLATVGSYSIPTFADLNADGRLDALVGETDGDLNHLYNTGSATSPGFIGPTANSYGLADVGSFSAPTFADIDADGDLDVFVGESDGTINYFRNTGSAKNPHFVATTAPTGLADAGTYSTPTFADLDGDGDLDAFVGDGDGAIHYFRNTGTATGPAFAAASSNPFGLTDVGAYSAPAFADLDNDGDLDGFVGEDNGAINYFRNTGTAKSPAFAAASANPFGLADVGTYSALAFADLDGDGDLDVVVGGGDGPLNYFENRQLTNKVYLPLVIRN